MPCWGMSAVHKVRIEHNSARIEQVLAGHSDAENYLTGFLLPDNWTRLDIEKRILYGKQVRCAVVGY